MKHTLVMFFAILILIGSITASENQAASDSVEGFFKVVDRNHNGGITQKEYQKFCSKQWKRMDANQDGVATTQEIQSSFSILPKKYLKENPIFNRYDQNKDGKIEKSEIVRRRQRNTIFRRYDKNGDGVITPDEMKWGRKIIDRLFKANFKRLDKNGSNSLEEEELSQANSLEFLDTEGLFKLVDTNKDKKIDFKEYKKYPMQKFLLQFDADKDGKVTKEEFDQFHKDRFGQFDLDKNGKITVEELREYVKSQKKEGEAEEKADDAEVDDEADDAEADDAKADDTEADDEDGEDEEGDDEEVDEDEE